MLILLMNSESILNSPQFADVIVFASVTQLTCQTFKEALDPCFLTLYKRILLPQSSQQRKLLRYNRGNYHLEVDWYLAIL
jgi:hypothetical protein